VHSGAGEGACWIAGRGGDLLPSLEVRCQINCWGLGERAVDERKRDKEVCDIELQDS
jgi:hypothetical protein